MGAAQKVPLSRTLNQFAQNRAIAEIEKRGRSLPGKVIAVSGQIVTVQFLVSDATLPNVTMPLATSAYVRLPIQDGDLGCAISMDTAIAVVSGLGSAVANLYGLEGNLSCLVWVPTASKDFSTVDPNAVTIMGPNGVVLEDTGENSVFTLTPPNVNVATPMVYATQNLSVGNGANAILTDATGQVATFQNGILVNVD